MNCWTGHFDSRNIHSISLVLTEVLPAKQCLKPGKSDARVNYPPLFQYHANCSGMLTWSP